MDFMEIASEFAREYYLPHIRQLKRESLSQPLKLSHIPVLGHLRGAAALAVCLYHFTGGNFISPENPVRVVGSYGYLGVQAFFVISGFVIPYSLHLRSYTIRNAGSFLIRRLKRLEPPYICCIVLVICLNYISSNTPGYRGAPFSVNPEKLFAHVAYLNAILDYGWINPVFWTLAIEFQYYLFSAIAFPLLNHDKSKIRLITLLAIAMTGLMGARNTALLPHWLPLFAVGIATYEFMIANLTRRQFLIVLAIISCVSFAVLGFLATLVGVLTAYMICVFKEKQPPSVVSWLSWVGTISYSLYLVHVPIGGRVVNLAERFPNLPIYRYAASIVAIAMSIGGAWLFWRFVEFPSHLWARKSGSETVSHPLVINKLNALEAELIIDNDLSKS